MLRIKTPWKYGLAMILPLTVNSLPAQTMIEGEYCILRTAFNPNYPMGSEISKERIEQALLDGGFNDVAALLKTEGEVEMVRRGTLETLKDGVSSTFQGGEIPFLTTFHDSPNDGEETVRRSSQSTVTSGVTVQIAPETTEDGLCVEFEVDISFAYPVETTTNGRTTTLIGRDRLSFQGAKEVENRDVIVLRTSETREGVPVEYVVLMLVEIE